MLQEFLTRAEIHALQFIDQHGPITANRFWQKSWYRGQPGTFATSIKLLKNLHRKNLLSKTDGQSHYYRSMISPARLRVEVMRLALDVLFDGNTSELKAAVESLQQLDS